MQITDLADWVRALDEPSVAPLLEALVQTLDSFVEIGLGYLSLERPAGTLSGGESQRTKMIRHLGSSLTDVTYVFDEPTIGLHPHDVQRMNDLLLQLRDKGNTVLVVEHEPETIAIADHVVDLGPGAGSGGGTICYEGSVEGLRGSGTITGRHLDDQTGLKESVRPARARWRSGPGVRPAPGRRRARAGRDVRRPPQPPVPAAFGESPYSYLMTRRIERAKALLRRGDLTVTEVCLAVGFQSLGTFSTRFTELVGVPPSTYRQPGGRPNPPSSRRASPSTPHKPVRNREAAPHPPATEG